MVGEVLEVMRWLVATGLTIVMVTHETVFALDAIDNVMISMAESTWKWIPGQLL